MEHSFGTSIQMLPTLMAGGIMFGQAPIFGMVHFSSYTSPIGIANTICPAEREIGNLCAPGQQRTCVIADNNNRTLGYGQNRCEFGWWSSTCYNVSCLPPYQLIRRAPVYQDTCVYPKTESS